MDWIPVCLFLLHWVVGGLISGRYADDLPSRLLVVVFTTILSHIVVWNTNFHASIGGLGLVAAVMVCVLVLYLPARKVGKAVRRRSARVPQKSGLPTGPW